MDVEALSLETGEAVGNDLEAFPHGVEMIESFLQAEVAQVVGAKFIAQEVGELLVLLCVQRMLACSVGGESHRGKSQKPRNLDSKEEGN